MVNFDTLKASHRLRDAGFEEKQADALVNAFAQDIGANLATKDDIALLLKEMASRDEAIRKDMASEITAVRQEIATLRNEMALSEERMNVRFERQTARMTQLVVGMTGLVLAAIGIAAGILAAL